jgi:hypothetical protein
MSRPDAEILEAAHGDQRTLVTYDVHTITGPLRTLAASGAEHSGLCS